MIEQESRAERQKQLEAIKRNLGRCSNGRGAPLPGLRAARLSVALGQRELAARIGSNQQTIHALERQARGAYPKTIRRLCAALDVHPSDLLTAEAAEEE
jgi:DNA-binding Xre family transcriptional regulator